MTRYNITSNQRTLLLGGMSLGLLCLILSWFFDSTAHHTRFWTNFLHNSVFFTGIALMGIFFYAVCQTAWAGWHIQFKRVWEAMSAFLGVGFVLMGILGLGLILGWHHLYHWADSASVAEDKILKHKSSFLNIPWYLISILIVGVWFAFARKLKSISVREDAGVLGDFRHHMTSRWWSAAFLPVAGFSSCVVIWQWVMSIDAHWYSTLFAWYSGASLFVSMIALTIMILLYLQSKGYYTSLAKDHFHDLGKFLFAFSIFWTYLWFSQYMLIWYSNNGEETVYFKTRQRDFPVLFYGNLVINFLVPFFILMRNDTKRKVGSLMFTAGVVFLGHWIDFFLMIKPGALHTAHEVGGHGHHGSEAAHHSADAMHHGSHGIEAGFGFPGFIELGTMIGFLCLFLYVFYNALSKASLVPKNDPYLSESLHHHV